MWPLLSFAAGGLGAIGQLFSGFAGSSAAEAQARMDRMNAQLMTTQGQVAEATADMSLVQGALKADQVGRASRRAQGGAVSYFAGHNLALTGSPLLTVGYSAAQGATDMALAAARGEVGYAEGLSRSANLYGQAASQQWKAAQNEQKAKTDRMAAIFGAGTTLLSAGAKAWPGLSASFGGAAAGAGAPMIGDPWNVTGGLY
ncbi:hypothetical protein ACWX0K_10985 [Nitrobacteraceae bacterium UC4446_H13]